MIAVAAFGLTACGGSTDPGYVTAADMGDQWPLTVDAGTLHCYNGAQITITVGAQEYAINGPAQTNRGDGVKLIDEIRADQPGDLGLKKDMGPLIERGQNLC